MVRQPESSLQYPYWYVEAHERLLSVGGNYIFARLFGGRLYPIYIGEGINLYTRIHGHERLQEIIRHGATHLMTHTTPAGETARLREERDLIARWNPPLNVHHRSTAYDLAEALRRLPPIFQTRPSS